MSEEKSEKDATYKSLQDFILHNKKASIRELVDASQELRRMQSQDPTSLFSQLKVRAPLPRKLPPPTKTHVDDFLTRQERARVYANGVLHPELVKPKDTRDEEATVYATRITQYQSIQKGQKTSKKIINPFETMGDKLLTSLL